MQESLKYIDSFMFIILSIFIYRFNKCINNKQSLESKYSYSREKTLQEYTDAKNKLNKTRDLLVQALLVILVIYLIFYSVYVNNIDETSLAIPIVIIAKYLCLLFLIIFVLIDFFAYDMSNSIIRLNIGLIIFLIIDLIIQFNKKSILQKLIKQEQEE